MGWSDCAAVVLAAGNGSRMKSSTKKQYMELFGKPLIYYSLRAFEEAGFLQIILVTGADEIEYCQKEIVERYRLTHVTDIVCGGEERFDSVYEGLKAVKGKKYVFIHDGARPCLSRTVLNNCLEGVQKYEACVAAVPVKDTIKIADSEGMVAKTPKRSSLWSIQTPQVFTYDLIRGAFENLYADQNRNVQITDDAMVVENYSNHKVKLVMGSYENRKATTPDDLITIKSYIKS